MAREKKTNDAAPKVARPRTKKTATATVEAPIAPDAPTSPGMQAETIEERIRRRAYELSLQRGEHGNPHDDWIRAEEEILGKRSA